MDLNGHLIFLHGRGAIGRPREVQHRPRFLPCNAVLSWPRPRDCVVRGGADNGALLPRRAFDNDFVPRWGLGRCQLQTTSPPCLVSVSASHEVLRYCRSAGCARREMVSFRPGRAPELLLAVAGPKTPALAWLVIGPL